MSAMLLASSSSASCLRFSLLIWSSASYSWRTSCWKRGGVRGRKRKGWGDGEAKAQVERRWRASGQQRSGPGAGRRVRLAACDVRRLWPGGFRARPPFQTRHLCRLRAPVSLQWGGRGEGGGRGMARRPARSTGEGRPVLERTASCSAQSRLISFHSFSSTTRSSFWRRAHEMSRLGCGVEVGWAVGARGSVRGRPGGRGVRRRRRLTFGSTGTRRWRGPASAGNTTCRPCEGRVRVCGSA